jgi:hypothetical protein
MLKRECRICGNVFHVPPKQSTRAYCDQISCRDERRNRELAKERKKYRLVQKGLKKIQPKRKPDQGRRWTRCGCNCFPNYFYCTECHRYVSANEYDYRKADESNDTCSLA